MQEAFVLLVTDRPDATLELERGIRRIAGCRRADPRDPLPAERPAALCLALRDPSPGVLAALAAELRRSQMPGLCLVPRPDATAGALARSLGLQVMPASAPRTAILAALVTVLERSAREAAARSERLTVRTARATRLVTGLFASAAAGEAIDPTGVEEGTETVLEAISEAGIRAWLEAVWAHDSQIYQHTLSVAGYGAAFAVQLGLARDDAMRLSRAALLHDIGKSRIPQAILLKPGPLTEAEFAVMRTHAAIGADLLIRQGGFAPELVDVVRHHHEKLDGSGYPDGLAGAEIKDLVRLVTICDIYSALTERRTYRAPMAAADALKIMWDMSPGLDASLLTAFEPVVTRVDSGAW